MRNFIICTLHQMLLMWSDQRGWNGWKCSTNEHEKFNCNIWSANLKGSDQLEDLDVDGKVV